MLKLDGREPRNHILNCNSFGPRKYVLNAMTMKEVCSDSR